MLNLIFYDAFVVFTKGSMTIYDVALVKKIRSTNKPFFLVKTNLDFDYYKQCEKEKITEEKMLKQAMQIFLKSAKDLSCDEKQIFLIGNKEPEKWDFVKLMKEIEMFADSFKKKNDEKSCEKPGNRTQDISWWREDMNIIEWRKQFFYEQTKKVSKNYLYHEKITFISSNLLVMLFLLYQKEIQHVTEVYFIART